MGSKKVVELTIFTGGTISKLLTYGTSIIAVRITADTMRCEVNKERTKKCTQSVHI